MAANSSPPETKHGEDDKFPDTVFAGAGRTASFFKASIYRVPEKLRKLKESAYTPSLVFIGPFHRRLESPQSRDLKMWYVNSFVSRTAFFEGIRDKNVITNRKDNELMTCKKEMAECLDEAKKRYAEEVDKLDAEMLVVDGCFILEILCRYKAATTSNNKPNNGGEESSKTGMEPKTEDPIFLSPLIYNTVLKDLLLLENQIPFFVLKRLFDLTIGRITKLDLIRDYIIPCFQNVMVPEPCESAVTSTKILCSFTKDCAVSIIFGRTDGEKKDPKAPEEMKEGNDHILQILHDHKLPPKRNGKREFVPCASKLKNSGVKFLAGSGQDLSEIDFYEEKGRFGWFRSGKFKIPKLSIYDSTELVLRNLIAFEQCRPTPNVSRYFTSYALLMDNLVSSEEDVKVLEEANVIRDNLGSEKDICDLLNNITKEIVLGPEDFFFANTCKNAREYSNSEWSKFMANFRSKWFASPWTVVAFCFAFLAFGISITQFIRSFLK